MLLQQHLLVPVAGGATTDAAGNTDMQVLCSRDAEGNRIAYVFTSQEAMDRWRPSKGEGPRRQLRQQSFWATGLRVFEVLAGVGAHEVRVDAGGEDSYTLSEEEVMSLAQAHIPRPGRPETFDLPGVGEVTIRPPQHPYPPDIHSRIAGLVAAEPLVAFAYLPEMEYPHSPGKPAEVLILVPTAAATEGPGRIGRAMQEIIPEGRLFDIMTIPPDHELLGLAMRTGCILAVNDATLHGQCLADLGLR